eukprot:6214741-Pleurochrysis_carterae.AAC.3
MSSVAIRRDRRDVGILQPSNIRYPPGCGVAGDASSVRGGGTFALIRGLRTISERPCRVYARFELIVILMRGTSGSAQVHAHMYANHHWAQNWKALAALNMGSRPR